MFDLSRLKNHDYIITICIVLLSVISLLIVFSTTYHAQTAETGAGTFKKQIVFFIAGFAIYFVLSSIRINWFRNFKLLLIVYIFTIILLVYVKFFGEDIANTNRWIVILGFNIQPAEYAKIALILITSAIFGIKDDVLGSFIEWNGKKAEGKRIRSLINLYAEKFPQLYMFIFSALLTTPIVILVFIQPAFGNSIIITAIWLAVVFAASYHQMKIINFVIPIIILSLAKWGILNFEIGPVIKLLDISFVLLVVVSILTLIIALKTKLPIYFAGIAIVIGLVLNPIVTTIWKTDIISAYQKERVETFFQSPEKDPLDAGYQVKQSKIAIGAGQLWGRGYLQGTQSSLQVLPFAHTDFIFAALAEQFGLFGCIILVSIYAMMLFRIVKTSIEINEEFSFLVGIGITTTMMLSIFINIGMNMGKLPVTGIPLPLLSYGGSSVLVNMIGLGLIQSIRQDVKIKDISESFTPLNSPWR